MNEIEMETMLRSLRPAAASPALEARVEQEMRLGSALRVLERPTLPKARLWQPVAWAGIGAAAAVFVMSLMQPAPVRSTGALAGSHSESEAQPVPVSTTRDPIYVDDQGVQYNAQQLPERHVRFVSLERREWIDPRDGAQISVEVPREETLVLPVEFQ